MLNIKRWNSKRGLLTLFVTALLALPLHAGAQESQQDDTDRRKRPPLPVRVVADSSVGIPVVVVGGTRAASMEPTAVRLSPRRRSESPSVRSRRPAEIEDWLLGGPAQQESWLTPAAAQPAQAPVAAPVARGSSQLLGVQHYLESTQARAATDPPTVRQRPVTFAVSQRAAGTAPVPVPTGPFAQQAPVLGTYRLGPGDQIDVHVWRNPDLSRSVPVRPDGRISLPLAGELMATGKTVAQLNAQITTLLEEYVQYPTVTVTVTQVRSMVIYVSGRVIRAGPLTLDRAINVVQAITMAGGMQEFADRNGVVVIRTINGQRVRIPFRYGDAVKGKGNVAEFVLQSGDVVYVP